MHQTDFAYEDFPTGFILEHFS